MEAPLIRPVQHVERSSAQDATTPAAAKLWGLAMPQTKRTNPSFDPQTWMPRPESSATLRSLASGEGRTTAHLQQVRHPRSDQSVSSISLPTGYGSRIARDFAEEHRRRNPKPTTRVPQALHHIRYGFDLARRGATNTAKEEFTEAMWAVARAKDAAETTGRHCEALSRALQTMREADEFTVAARAADATARVAKIARYHRSPAARDVIRRELGAIEAMQVYFANARSDFVTAVGGDAAGSLALFGLARSYLHQNTQRTSDQSLSGARSMTLLLAAHQMDGNDHRVSNELGVLYAKYGDTPNAEKMLKRSLVSQESPEAWQNISKVWQSAGKGELASYAGQRSGQLGPSERTQRANQVRFVEAEEMIAAAPAQKRPAASIQRADAGGQQPPAPTQIATPHREPKKKWWKRIFAKPAGEVAHVSATQTE